MIFLTGCASTKDAQVLRNDYAVHKAEAEKNFGILQSIINKILDTQKGFVAYHEQFKTKFNEHKHTIDHAHDAVPHEHPEISENKKESQVVTVELRQGIEDNLEHAVALSTGLANHKHGLTITESDDFPDMLLVETTEWIRSGDIDETSD